MSQRTHYVPKELKSVVIPKTVIRCHASDQLNLTSRELAVINLLREGRANKVIAIKLNMRESTVKVHVRNILQKLRVSNRTHAATRRQSPAGEWARDKRRG